LLAGGGDASKLALVSSAHRPAGYYLVPFGYLVLYGGVEVGESLAEFAHEPLDVLGTALQHGTVD
jgi:hypothetical protein